MRVAVLGLMALTSCLADGGEPVAHEEPSDFEVEPADGKGDGISAVFNQHDIVSDDLFLDGGNMDVAEVQRFFEHTPYGVRSWLADHKLNGVSAAQIVISTSRQEGIHPLMLIARMQVEASLVSKSTRPSQALVDRALGCGCADGADCVSVYVGLDKQIACGAKTLRTLFEDSIEATGAWQLGLTKKSLDHRWVTPTNHATAALYAYTPWVLVNTGGNWLAWNVTRKFVRHAEAAGYLATR